MENKRIIWRCLLGLVIGVAGINHSANAQCPDNEIFLTDQNAVSFFSATYPGCTQLKQGLTVNIGNGSDLSGLSVITKIDGSLSIGYGPNVASLNGLQNITSVGGDVLLLGLGQITDLTGLEKLSHVGGNFQIIENPKLESLKGLNALTSVDVSIDIERNALLTNLDKLSGITSVKGLVIINNPLLTSLSGLENLTSISEYLDIRESNGLSNLNELSGLTSLTGSVALIGNPLLNDLGIFSFMTEVTGSFEISENDALTNLNGLENITLVTGDLRVSGKSLTSLAALNQLGSVTGFLGILSCPVLPSLSGLDNLTNVGGIAISRIDLLTNLVGLDGLTTIPLFMSIEFNPLLTNLNGLQNLSSEVRYLGIIENALLTDITQLSKIKIITDHVTIAFNPSLSNCTIGVICRAIAGGVAYVAIEANTGACENLVAVESDCSALPVTLIRFDAKNESNQVLLSWKTSSETNSSHFEIERSVAGTRWLEIGSVRSGGDSDHSLDYAFTDVNPLRGNNLYRLKMVDEDNTFAYSRIVNVNMAGTQAMIYPNPAKEQLSLHSSLAGAKIEIYTINGCLVQEGTALGSNAFNVSGLENGEYIFKAGGYAQKLLICR